MDVRTMARYVRARTDLQIRASNSNHNSHCDLILLNDGSELFWISTVVDALMKATQDPLCRAC